MFVNLVEIHCHMFPLLYYYFFIIYSTGKTSVLKFLVTNWTKLPEDGLSLPQVQFTNILTKNTISKLKAPEKIVIKISLGNKLQRGPG